MQTDLDERVRLRAYELWLEAGQPSGREHEFWALASREIEGDGDKTIEGSRPSG